MTSGAGSSGRVVMPAHGPAGHLGSGGAMGCDLDVDTDGMRGAAALLERAAGDFAGHPAAGPPATPTEHAAGSSAAGREALRAALSRSEQAVQAAGMLAALAEDLAGRVTRAARRFDEAEVLCRGGR